MRGLRHVFRREGGRTLHSGDAPKWPNEANRQKPNRPMILAIAKSADQCRFCDDRVPSRARYRAAALVFIHRQTAHQPTLRRPRTFIFRAPGSPVPLFPFPLQARGMERREAPGALAIELPGDLAIGPLSAVRERSLPLRAGAGASWRSIRDARSAGEVPGPRHQLCAGGGQRACVLPRNRARS